MSYFHSLMNIDVSHFIMLLDGDFGTSVGRSVLVSLLPFIDLSLGLSICLSVCRSVRLSFRPSFCLSVFLSSKEEAGKDSEGFCCHWVALTGL